MPTYTLSFLLPTLSLFFFFFFFNDTATTEIYTLSLHDALPIFRCGLPGDSRRDWHPRTRIISRRGRPGTDADSVHERSEEHTSELQSPCNLVCRLLLEKKKKKTQIQIFKLIVVYTACNLLTHAD